MERRLQSRSGPYFLFFVIFLSFFVAFNFSHKEEEWNVSFVLPDCLPLLTAATPVSVSSTQWNRKSPSGFVPFQFAEAAGPAYSLPNSGMGHFHSSKPSPSSYFTISRLLPRSSPQLSFSRISGSAASSHSDVTLVWSNSSLSSVSSSLTPSSLPSSLLWMRENAQRRLQNSAYEDDEEDDDNDKEVWLKNVGPASPLGRMNKLTGNNSLRVVHHRDVKEENAERDEKFSATFSSPFVLAPQPHGSNSTSLHHADPLDAETKHNRMSEEGHGNNGYRPFGDLQTDEIDTSESNQNSSAISFSSSFFASQTRKNLRLFSPSEQLKDERKYRSNRTSHFSSSGSVRNTRYWLQQYGVPDRLPPAAWCESLPLANSPFSPSSFSFVSSDDQNILPPRMFVAVPSNSSRSYVLQHAAGWNRPSSDCPSELRRGFFNPPKIGASKVDAWLASAPYSACGGYVVETETQIYFTNVFRPPGPENNVVVTCACSKDEFTGHADNYDNSETYLSSFPSSSSYVSSSINFPSTTARRRGQGENVETEIEDENSEIAETGRGEKKINRPQIHKAPRRRRRGQCIPTVRWEVSTNAKEIWTSNPSRDIVGELEGNRREQAGKVVEERRRNEEWSRRRSKVEDENRLRMSPVAQGRRLRKKKSRCTSRGCRSKRRSRGCRSKRRRYETNKHLEEGFCDERPLENSMKGNGKRRNGGEAAIAATSKLQKQKGSVPGEERHVVDPIINAIAGGYVVSGTATAGAKNEITVAGKGDRLIFESHSYGIGLYPWPIYCEALCSAGIRESTCLQPLVIDGCPVRDDLDFQPHPRQKPSAENPYGLSPESIVFSFAPFVFEKDLQEVGHSQPLTVRCQMELFSSPNPGIESFCSQPLKIQQTYSSPHPTASPKRTIPDSSSPFRRLIPRNSHHRNTMKQITGWQDIRGNGMIASHMDHISAKAADELQTLKRSHEMIMTGGYGDEAEWEVEGGRGFGGYDGGRVQPPPSLEGQVYSRERYTPPVMEDAFKKEVNDFTYDDWNVKWEKDREAKSMDVKVGNDDGFVGVGVNENDRAAFVNTGWGDTVISVAASEADRKVGVGVVKGNYGVNIDRSNINRMTSVEVVARGVETASLVDFVDRDYGQRIKVRDLSIGIRHDFDEFIYQDDDEMASTVSVFYKSVGVEVETDVVDTEYAFSFSSPRHKYSVLRDFNEREIEFQGNWGSGWKLVLESDFADPFSNEIFGRIGFGKVGTAYVSAGAGISSDGATLGSAEIEVGDVGLSVNINGDGSNRILEYSVNIGKFAYVWECKVVPDNIKMPVLLGITKSRRPV